MTKEEQELEILESLDKGELTKEEADDLMMKVTGANEPIVPEAHPAFKLDVNNMKGMGSRFKYKTLAVNPEEGLKYLQQRHPDLNFKFEPGGGSVLVKSPGDKEWRYVDPPSFDAQDISDLAFDVPAGLIEGGATALGGIAGGTAGLLGGPAAPATVPAGALAGGAAAGAGAGNIIERGRQGLSRLAGVSETPNQEQIDTATMFGAASPLFFGTGAGVKQVAKSLGKSGLSEQALRQVAQGQRSAVGQGLSTVRGQVMPRIAQTATNIDKETFNWAANNLDKIQGAGEEFGQVGVYEDLSSRILEGHQSLKGQHSELYGDALENLNVEVPVEEIEAPLRKLLGTYQERAAQQIEKHGEAALNKVDVQNAEYLERVLGEYTQGSGVLRGREAQHTLDILNDLTGVRKATVPGKMEKVDRELQNAAKEATKILDKAIVAQDSGKALKEAKELYRKDLARENTLKKYFETPEKTESTLNNLLSPKRNARRKQIMTIAEEVGVPVDESAREAIATSIFSKPSSEVLSIGGRTSTGVKIPAEIAGGAAGYYLGSQFGGEGHGSGVAGLLAGRYIGGRAFAPSTVRTLMEMNARGAAVNQGIQNMTPAVGPNLYQAVPQVWQNLEQNRR